MMNEFKKRFKELKGDKELMEDFVTVINHYMETEELSSPEKSARENVKSFINGDSEQQNIALEALNVLDKNQYHNDKDWMSEELYQDSLKQVSRDLSDKFGKVKKDQRLDNPVGYELKPFYSIGEILKEREQYESFKEVFDDAYKLVSEQKPQQTREQDAETMLTIANTLKKHLLYHDKEQLTNEMYQGSVEKVYNLVKKEYDISDSENDKNNDNVNEIDTSKAKELFKANDPEQKVKNGELLADVYHPITRPPTAEKVWESPRKNGPSN